MSYLFGRGKAYCLQAQQIVLNVYDYFSNGNNEEDHHSAATVKQRTVRATGMPERSLRRLTRNGIRQPRKRGPVTKPKQNAVDNFDRGAIRRLIEYMYLDKIWPTVASIYERVKKELNFQGSKSTLSRILKHMGYRYSNRKTTTRQMLKERYDVVAKRHAFITRMKTLRLTGRSFMALTKPG